MNTNSTSGLWARSQSIWRSLRSLPVWVQVWVVGILVPVNAAAFFLLDTAAGVATAWAAVFVVATNMPIMYWYGGMNRAMSIPHLMAWGPLQVWLALRLIEVDAPVGTELFYIWLLLLVNGVSLVFDLIDSWRWLKGARETPGVDDMKVSS